MGDISLLRGLFISIAVIFVGCVSTDNTQFYHPDYGVVDGNHDKLMVDSQTCYLGFSSETSDTTESTLAVVGLLAQDAGEQAIENLAVTAILLRKGYKLAKNQSSCMTQKGWLRLESAK